MACLLFYHRGEKKWQLFSNTLTPSNLFFFALRYLCRRVLLIFNTAMEQTMDKKRGRGVLGGRLGCFAWDGEAAPYRRPVIRGGVKHLAGLFR